MELNIYQHLAQVAPGFVGVATSKLMCGDIQKEKLDNSVLKYFLYTGVSYISSELVQGLVYYLDITFSQNAVIILNIFIAALIGALWHLCLKDFVVKYANKINKLFGKNEIFLSDTLLEKLSRDNKPHYWAIYKDEKLLGSGWLEHVIANEKSLSVKKFGDYDIEKMKEERTIVYLDKNYYIKEYIEDEKK